MHDHVSRIAIRYAETDAMGVVHHASYLVWFEVGRTEWLQARGYSYAEFEQTGFYLVVAEVGLRYLRPARYGHDVLLHTFAREVQSRAVRFEYEVRHATTDELLVTGFSRHILTGHDGAIRRFPPEMLNLISE